MNIRVIQKKEQAIGSFNQGEILENKPIGFPQDGGQTKPYSNLFYWAHAYSTKGSTIGLHPHKGFEIISFVLKGLIKHYDTSTDKWLELTEGGLQVIKSGSGISHSEEITANSEIFQIWFDPNIRNSITKKAEYGSFESSSFPEETINGVKTKTIIGDSSPVELDTEDIEIHEILITKNYTLKTKESKTYSIYAIDGQVCIKNKSLNKDDFAIISDTHEIKFETKTTVKLFIISSPKQPSYKTYMNY